MQNRAYNDAAGSLRGLSIPLQNATLLDFWKWAFCDLCDDDLKGIFIEWVVAKLINHKTHRRVNWADSDLILDDGTRIEVKASAFWQSWRLLDELGEARKDIFPIKDRTKIRFAGLKARTGSSGYVKGEARFKSDIYVFAFQKEEDSHKWNAMDMSQWEFYVTRKENLNQGSVSPAFLAARGYGPLTADEMAVRVVQEIDIRKSSSGLQQENWDA